MTVPMYNFNRKMLYHKYFPNNIPNNFHSRHFLEPVSTAVFMRYRLEGFWKRLKFQLGENQKLILHINLFWIWIYSIFLSGPCKSLAGRKKLCFYYSIKEISLVLKKSIAQKVHKKETLKI